MSRFGCKLSVRASLWDAKANQSGRQKPRSPAHQRKAGKYQDQYIGKRDQRLCDRNSYVTAEKIRNASLGMGDDCRLLLQTDNYKRLWAEDAEKIRRLGVKIKNLEAAARHEVEIAGPIDAAVRDTVVIRDTVPILRQKVEMNTPYPADRAYRERTSERRNPCARNAAAGCVGRIQGLVVLETGKSRTPDHSRG